jgi:glycosyltransferase involved in cell wall biosynthesis
MKIWFLNHFASPLSGSSGTRHAVLAKNLSEMGHEVTIFASPTSREHISSMVQFKNGEIFSDQNHDGVRFRFIKTLEYNNNVRRMLNMISFRKNVLRSLHGLDKPDIVIGSCVHLHAADAGRIIAKKYNIPFVFEIRDIWPESLVDVGAMSRLHPVYLYLRRIELRLYRNADHIITLLPGSNVYLNDHGIPSEKIIYLPNGIYTSLYPDMQHIPERKEFIATFFGAHGPANGLDTLVSAARLLQNDPNGRHIYLQLIGEGTSKPSLIKMKESYGLHNLEFHDRMKKKELFIKSQESDAFIFHLKDMPVLKRYGISSNKLFDYLMCGRPVVFACNSYNDPVREANAGISIPPNDPESMANALIQLRDLDPKKRMEMGIRGREWVIANHDLSKLSIELANTLQRIIHNS